MTWFDVLIQGEIVRQKLKARGKTPSDDMGTWMEIDAGSEAEAKRIAMRRYGRPSFVKKIKAISEEEMQARRISMEKLFADEEIRRLRES